LNSASNECCWIPNACKKYFHDCTPVKR
jgi:hypothetical protein